jgi:hypothetical protein
MKLTLIFTCACISAFAQTATPTGQISKSEKVPVMAPPIAKLTDSQKLAVRNLESQFWYAQNQLTFWTTRTETLKKQATDETEKLIAFCGGQDKIDLQNLECSVPPAKPAPQEAKK